MSTIVDNITLTLVSLKKELIDYLNDNAWENKYSIFHAGDESLRYKEIVKEVTEIRKQIALPVITLNTGFIRGETQEIGDIYGRDLIYTAILIQAVDINQLNTLSNIVRRKVNDLEFTVYDYTKAKKENVGTAIVSDVLLEDLSDFNSENIVDRYNSLINLTIEVTAQNLI
jgi:hypothetical protein